MVICGIFHVYISNREGRYQYLDGRIIRDIDKKDKLIVVRDIDIKEHIKKCDNKGCFEINIISDYEVVFVDSFFFIRRVLGMLEWWKATNTIKQAEFFYKAIV